MPWRLNEKSKRVKSDFDLWGSFNGAGYTIVVLAQQFYQISVIPDQDALASASAQLVVQLVMSIESLYMGTI